MAVLSAQSEEVSEITTTSYMKLTHTVAYYGDALYGFSTDAIWLTMPYWQQTDSIGSCAPTLAIDNDTRSGQITYVKKYSNSTTGETYTQTYSQDITRFKNAQNGDWYGSVGIFTFPYGGVYDDTTVTCISLRAHYEFETYFNSVGTYCHRRGFNVADPSISISLGNVVSATIGFGSLLADDNISAELLLHYIPD